MRISSFISEMYDLKFKLKFLPNIAEEIAIADWFSRAESTLKNCSGCRICDIARRVTGNDLRRFQSALHENRIGSEFCPPGDLTWADFAKLPEDEAIACYDR